jgi:uncharacterized protein (DUF1499 family)
MAEVKPAGLGVKIRNVFVMAGVVLAVFVPIWVAAAALGTKFGLWPWTIGLGRMIGGIGVPLIGLMMVVTFITSLLVVFIKPRAGFGALAGMWLVSLAAVGIGLSVIIPARDVPPIHDISTDTANPLTFSAKIMSERGKNSNKIVSPNEASVPFDKERLNDWSGRSIADIQADAYPQIKPLILEGQVPSAAYQKALASLKKKGFRIVSQDPDTARIEAVAESFWFGFKDDVVIAISASGTGSKVDVRSVSRVGMSDLGANAKRVEAILAGIKG